MQGLFTETPVEDIYSKLDSEFLGNAVGGRNSRAAAIGNTVNRGLGMVGSAFGMEDSRVQKAKDKQAAIAEAKEKATPGDMGSMYSELAKAFASRGLMNEAAAAGEAARKLGREDAQEYRAQRADMRAERQMGIQESQEKDRADEFAFKTKMRPYDEQLKKMGVEQLQKTLQGLDNQLSEFERKRAAGHFAKMDQLELDKTQAEIQYKRDQAKAALISANASASNAASRAKEVDANIAHTQAQTDAIKQKIATINTEVWETDVKTDMMGNTLLIKTEKRPKPGFEPKQEIFRIDIKGNMQKITAEGISAAPKETSPFQSGAAAALQKRLEEEAAAKAGK